MKEKDGRNILKTGVDLLTPQERLLTGEHEKQTARLQKRPYVPGQRLAMIGFGRFMARSTQINGRQSSRTSGLYSSAMS